ncbi:MAG: carbamate kinase, partial [Candidatus Marinimicrobia bacterium]|nr:carbamate kinase [Candidatus Neomarinimicrobiota bacterium]
SLQNALLDEDIHRDVVSIITQVVVDEHDPALAQPTKFIGHQYRRRKAERLARQFNWDIGRQTSGVWRRVVPSPQPLRINNARSIRKLVEEGSIVIASGGGGIPAYIMRSGHFEGVDAVIDKDLAAAVLGTDMGAQEMYILTDVPEVCLNFNTANEQPLRKLTTAQAEKHLADGQFPPGSMGPKISAALTFIRQGGKKVVLTDIDSIDRALKGEAGTTIYK